ncbi:MAG: MiaB/RimO family radical SAM methylthiotransferase, partial [Syntrophobacterales bacterium]|nr:MiaB/RimO family radical SAM methylthiotransferase [Syntrophobacterales bacterium]
FAFHPVDDFPGHTRAFLKIQDGCNARCTYCIVPQARGGSRSLSPERVLLEIRRLAQKGYREIVLTGIHLGAYGADLSQSAGLLDLLRAIEEDAPEIRIRLSSLEPAEVTDDLIRFAAGSQRLCPHFHIPLQSGDDKILTAMGRTYTAAAFRRLVDRIHERMPHAAIGLDVLAGFPGEDEQAAQRTLHLIASLPISHLHVFPYSKRPGTPAAAMPRQVEEKTKKERTERLRNLGRQKKSAFARLQVGTDMTVLIEGGNVKAREMKGLTGNYLTVLLDRHDPLLVNRFVSVSMTGEEDGSLRGIIKMSADNG